jgi:hypothetical protein
MPECPREQEREEEEQREPDELDPARDPDRRRLGHAAMVARRHAVPRGREKRFHVRYRGSNGLAALPASRAPA